MILMGYKYTKSSIDDNHNEIVKEFRSLGAVVTSTTCVKEFCDMVVCYNSHFILVEVKDGKKPKSKQKLTEREQKYHDEVSRVGGVVHIINDKKQVKQLIQLYNE